MRLKIGWKGTLAAVGLLAVLAAAGVRYGEWVLRFADVNRRVAFPDDLAIVAPGRDVPEAFARFSGLWGNDRWDGGPLPIALAVERVEADGEASVVYGWGTDQVEHRRQGWQRLPARIDRGRLRFRFADQTLVEWQLTPDGRLLGRQIPSTDWRSYALLERQKTRETAARRSEPLWEDIRIPERAEVGDAKGKAIELQATLYRDRRPGRRKVIVLSPGSTDRRDPATTIREEEQARFFLGLGYSVVVPMRKGRGASGGPLIEARDFAGPPPSTEQIESGIEDLDAVVEYLKAQDWVDPGGIVLAGKQHGGLLSVAYAGRFPQKIAAVVNFAGGWWPQEYQGGRLDREVLAEAGRHAVAPMLWLYAEDDPLWGLDEAARKLAAFASGANGPAGAKVRLLPFPDPGFPKIYSSQVFDWTGKWEDAVAAFLAGTPPPRGAGVVFLDIPGPPNQAPLPSAVFYPAEIGPGGITVAQQTIAAVNHAPIAEGRFPIVLLSPVYGLDRVSQHDTATELARRGFIVIAVNHPGEDAPRADHPPERALYGREYDLRAALDAIMANKLLAAHAEPDRVGVAGFGFGAVAALELAGAVPAQPPEHRDLAPFRDERVKALALLAPASTKVFAGDGFGAVSAAVRIYRPGAEPDSEAEQLRTALALPSEYVEVPAARSRSFRPPCSPSQREAAPQACVDPPGMNRSAFHVRLNDELAEFFARTLRGP